MNHQHKTAAEIEAQQDATERQRPYSASAAEVAAIAEQLRQTNAGQVELSKRLTAEIDRRQTIENSIETLTRITKTINRRLAKLDDFTGINNEHAEPLQEAIDTNAEHIGEILRKHSGRLAQIEQDRDAPNLDQLRPLYAVLHSMFGR